jgi:D-tyrosyl-tRNA(Tyr) deacylase
MFISLSLLFKMRAVIQRVKSATVRVNTRVISTIGPGLLILLGVEVADTDEDINWLSQKVAQIRIFPDQHGYMNISSGEAKAQLMVISQFTLLASTKKGNRPSFIKAAPAVAAEQMYEKFVKKLTEMSQSLIQTGSFGADMQVELINDGPVTIIIDSKNKE